jgi:formate C-acetyltransferase
LCKRKTIFIQDGELIVGHPSGKIRAAALSPENNYRVLSNELDTISTREMDPFIINEEQKVLFKERIEPYWKGKSFRDIWNATAFEELRLLNESLVTSIIVEGGGIYIPNYELVTKIGINGIRKRIKKRLTSLDAAIPGDYNKIMYLNTLLIVCEGIETLAKRYSRLAKKEANDEIDPRRKAELERIAEICKQVPSGPARTFWEALQSLWFFHACAWMQGTTVYNLGRLDQYLYPYYKKDIEEGTLTQDEAQELLECLWVKFAELCLMGDKYTAYFIPGYPVFQQITCGGITQSGQDAVNELSYMMIQATMDIRLAQPNLSVKYNKRKNPDSFLRKAVELLSLGAGHPQFYNDEVGIKYVMDMGIPFEDAYNWSPAGCKDIALMGKIGNLRVPISVNLASTLELILLNGVQRSTGNRLPVLQTGELNKFNTYGEFKEAFKTQLAYLIKKAAEIALIVEDIVQQQKPQIVASLSFEECIENARDCMAGGAKYNPGPEIVTVGHADTYNSLAAIKKLIYDDKKLTWDQLLKALNNDFEGYEEIREMCLAAPKYGNDIAEVDEIATEITGFAAEEVRKYKGLHGGRRVVVTTAAAGHLFQGKAVGALPSGRKAWTPLSDGISPMQGTDRNGPTAALKSISKSCLDRYCAPLLNMKTDPTIFKDERGIGNFMSFLKSWYDLGIYHIQFNIVSPDTLKDAQVHPDKYRGLMVRVSGYCACFVDLYKEIQDDIIARTTFETVH